MKSTPEPDKPIVVGLDIGTTHVRAVVGQYNDQQQVNILGMGQSDSEGVRRGSIFHIEKTVKAIQEALAEAERHANIDIFKVHVGVGGDHIRSQQDNHIITVQREEDEISEDDFQLLCDGMRKRSVHAGMEILHVIPQDFSVDDNEGIDHPVGMPGMRLKGNFHIVTGQSSALRTLHRCVNKTERTVDGTMLQSLGAAKAVLSDEEKEAGVVLLDIGGGTTDVAIYNDNHLRHTAVIPFAGDIVTKDIQEGLQIMRTNAASLKQRAGRAYVDETQQEQILTISDIHGRSQKQLSALSLGRIIQARMEELLEMVCLEIKRAGYWPDQLVGGVKLVGGSAHLKGLGDLVEFVTGMDCTIGRPGELLAKGMTREVNEPAFATAIGLMLEGLEEAGTKVSDERAHHVRTQGETDGFIKVVKNWFEKAVKTDDLQ